MSLRERGLGWSIVWKSSSSRAVRPVHRFGRQKKCVSAERCIRRAYLRGGVTVDGERSEYGRTHEVGRRNDRRSAAETRDHVLSGQLSIERSWMMSAGARIPSEVSGATTFSHSGPGAERARRSSVNPSRTWIHVAGAGLELRRVVDHTVASRQCVGYVRGRRNAEFWHVVAEVTFFCDIFGAANRYAIMFRRDS